MKSMIIRNPYLAPARKPRPKVVKPKVEKPKMWMSTVPGDETTRPIEVKNIPKDLREFAKNARATVAEVRKLSSLLNKADSKLRLLQTVCKHHVFIDKRDSPVCEVFRSCAICGTNMGMI